MAAKDEDGRPKASTVFPPPPVFYRSYGANAAAKHPMAVSLEPPAIPKGMYRSFGDPWDPDEKEKTLKEQEREELFERPEGGFTVDFLKKEISRLCKLLLTRYGEFVKALGDMDVPAPKLAEMTEEFTSINVNITYLVNQFRNAQGRQLLINKLKAQIEQRKQSAANLRRLIQEGHKQIMEKVSEVSTNAVAGISDEAGASTGGENPADMEVEQRTLNAFDLCREMM
ncbi:Mediator of RNA polymerase II transcription subunit 7 (Mediator complex subunit 7), partial [Durusdinium trenchii]